jgi:hypothetical protein
MTVYRPRYGLNYAVWVRCPNCGPTEPLMEGETFAPAGPTGTHRCSKCNVSAPYRECLIPERDREGGSCGKRCWNGKYECACICEGQCHSEQKCYCKKGA